MRIMLAPDPLEYEVLILNSGYNAKVVTNFKKYLQKGLWNSSTVGSPSRSWFQIFEEQFMYHRCYRLTSMVASNLRGTIHLPLIFVDVTNA